MKKKSTSTSYTSLKEKKNRNINRIFNNWPSSDEFKMRNLGLFQNRINLMRILFMNELYQKTLNVTETYLNLVVDGDRI